MAQRYRNQNKDRPKCLPKVEALVGSLGEVARRWNAAGFTTPQQGRAWTSNIVGRTLRLPRMAGLRVYHRQLLELDGKPVRAEFPGIVDVETWQDAQMILSDPRRRTSPSVGNQMLFTGVAVCGICGAGIHAGDKRGSGPRYRCSSGARVHRAAKPVEDYVTQAILYRLQIADAADVFELPADDATTKLREQLRQAQARYDRLPNLWERRRDHRGGPESPARQTEDADCRTAMAATRHEWPPFARSAGCGDRG